MENTIGGVGDLAQCLLLIMLEFNEIWKTFKYRLINNGLSCWCSDIQRLF